MSKADLIVSSHKRSIEQLRRLQKLPLEQKILLTQRRIDQFYRENSGQVYVAFSGGKDSTVLLDITRNLFPSVKAAFCDTGLEFPEIRDFVKTKNNVEWLKPKMTFNKVIDKYGYPVASKEISQKVNEIQTTKSKKLLDIRLNGGKNGNGKLSERWKFLIDAPFKTSNKCCDIMKKNPSKAFEKETGLKAIVGTMASESRLRTSNWLRNGCNSFSSKRKISSPLSFWSDDDIWEYINSREIEYADIYNKGYKRTGCTFCMFGSQYDNDAGRGRFNLMEKTHPKLHKYCMEKLELKKVLNYCDDNMELIKDKNTKEEKKCDDLKKIADEINSPIYKHDCKECTYVTTDIDEDIYMHGDYVIIRYGNNPEDNQSYPIKEFKNRKFGKKTRILINAYLLNENTLLHKKDFIEIKEKYK